MTNRLGLIAGLAISAAAPFASAATPQTGGAPQVRAAAPARPVLYAIVYRQGPNWKVGTPVRGQDLAEHKAYMEKLEADGVLQMAGPLLSINGGMILLRVRDLEAARAIMEADPALKKGIFLGEVSAWYIAFDPGKRFGG